MNKTRQPFAIAALLVFASLTLAAVPAAGQIDQRARQDMGLVFDSLDSILKDLQTYDFASGVGALMRLHAYVFTHKQIPRTGRRPKRPSSSSSRARPRREG